MNAFFGKRWIREKTRLEPIRDTSLEIIAHPGAQLLLLDIDGDVAYALVSSYEEAQRIEVDDPLFDQELVRPNSSGVVVRLPKHVLSDTEITLAQFHVRPDVLQAERRLFGGPKEVGSSIELGCEPIEVLAELPGGVQKLRQYREGFEVRGFNRVPLRWSYEDNECSPRLVFDAPMMIGATQPPIPDGFMASDPAEGRLARRTLEKLGTVYAVELDGQTGLTCSSVSYSRGNLTISKRASSRSGRAEVVYDGSFDDTGQGMFDGPSVTRFDVSGGPVERIDFLCSSTLQLLRATPETIEFVSANNVIAYHPDDVTRWYRTREACETAIASHPRIPLEVRLLEHASVAPIRLRSGC